MAAATYASNALAIAVATRAQRSAHASPSLRTSERSIVVTIALSSRMYRWLMRTLYAHAASAAMRKLGGASDVARQRALSDSAASRSASLRTSSASAAASKRRLGGAHQCAASSARRRAALLRRRAFGSRLRRDDGRIRRLVAIGAPSFEFAREDDRRARPVRLKRIRRMRPTIATNAAAIAPVTAAALPPPGTASLEARRSQIVVERFHAPGVGG